MSCVRVRTEAEMARAARKNRFLSREKVERTFDTGYTRRCARCRESAKFAERDRFPATMYHIPTDTLEESGMRTYRT